jgi:type IV secretion system protein VirB5
MKLSDNPYLNGKRAFMEQWGDTAKAASQWRLAFFGATVGLVISLGGLIAVALQQKVVPYAVEFNEHSEVVRVARVGEITEPNNNQIRAALRSWIIGARTVYGDRRAQESLMDTTYAMILPSSSAYQTMSEYQTTNNPYVRSKKETVDVAVNSVLLADGSTWRIEWTETTKQLSGRVIDTKAWQATATVITVPPNSEQELLLNPLGVKIKQFSWQTRL